MDKRFGIVTVLRSVVPRRLTCLGLASLGLLGILMGLGLLWSMQPNPRVRPDIPPQAQAQTWDSTCGSDYCTAYVTFTVVMDSDSLVHFYQTHNYWCVDRYNHRGTAINALPPPFWECTRQFVDGRVDVAFPKDQPASTLRVHLTFGYHPAL